jgi:hypothetical protein
MDPNNLSEGASKV